MKLIDTGTQPQTIQCPIPSIKKFPISLKTNAKTGYQSTFLLSQELILNILLQATSLNNGKLNVKLPEQPLYAQGTRIYAHFFPLAQDLINNPCSPTNSHT